MVVDKLSAESPNCWLRLCERDENTCREPMTTSEIVELGRAIEASEKPKAEERKSPGTNQHTKEVEGKFPETSGQTRDKFGEAIGMSGKTYEKAKAVVDVALFRWSLPRGFRPGRDFLATAGPRRLSG